jgi:hypothetical protein
MTTIAWDGETLAADRQATNMASMYRTRKIFTLLDGSLVGIMGSADVCLLAIEWLNGNGEKPVFSREDDHPYMIVIRPDRTIWRYERYLIPIAVLEPFFAGGSGRDYALAAMACGKSAVEAVELAAIYDEGTGLGIDTLSLGHAQLQIVGE